LVKKSDLVTHLYKNHRETMSAGTPHLGHSLLLVKKECPLKGCRSMHPGALQMTANPPPNCCVKFIHKLCYDKNVAWTDVKVVARTFARPSSNHLAQE